jgi:hypothetical protein
MDVDAFEPVFVEFIPAQLEDGRLYVSMTYATASHLCACGCAERIVTPLSPADWELTFNGRVTLTPSIGNGQYSCRSHYLIRNNRVQWCKPMTRDAALTTLARDVDARAACTPTQPPGWLRRLLRWLRTR